MCGSQAPEQEAVKLKLLWRPQNVRHSSAVGLLLGKAVNREWKQPKTKNCVAVNKGKRSWTSDVEMQSLEFARLVFGLALVLIVFPHYVI